MKKLFFLGLVAVMLLPLIALGCSEKSATETTTTPSNNPTVVVTLDELSTQNTMLVYVEMVHPGTLTVRLGTNPSTGFSWGDAEITHVEVIQQTSRNYEPPTGTLLVGAPGTEVWVFTTKSTGLAIIRFTYGQAWAGGQQDLYSVTVNINVR